MLLLLIWSSRNKTCLNTQNRLKIVDSSLKFDKSVAQDGRCQTLETHTIRVEFIATIAKECISLISSICRPVATFSTWQVVIRRYVLGPFLVNGGRFKHTSGRIYMIHAFCASFFLFLFFLAWIKVVSLCCVPGERLHMNSSRAFPTDYNRIHLLFFQYVVKLAFVTHAKERRDIFQAKRDIKARSRTVSR